METNILIAFVILLFIISTSLYLLLSKSINDTKHYKNKYKEFFEKYISIREKYDFLKNEKEQREASCKNKQ